MGEAQTPAPRDGLEPSLLGVRGQPLRRERIELPSQDGRPPAACSSETPAVFVEAEEIHQEQEDVGLQARRIAIHDRPGVAARPPQAAADRGGQLPFHGAPGPRDCHGPTQWAPGRRDGGMDLPPAGSGHALVTWTRRRDVSRPRRSGRSADAGCSWFLRSCAVIEAGQGPQLPFPARISGCEDIRTGLAGQGQS